ncbi:MAG: PEP-CTERM sorting domain-containing protein [Planctomycetota bacterium]|nr:MAG: PEP-CTERM sorting domain-containing protein [Planctomycetota bacterium]
MMKRISVLLMALALASAAEATVSFYIDGSSAPDSITLAQGASVTVEIHSDDTASWVGYAGMDIETMSPFGSVDNVQTYAAAGGNGWSTPYYEAGWMDGFELNTLTPNIQVGVQHSFDYTAPTADGSTTMVIFIPDYSGWEWCEPPTLNIVVPEPVTITLLGLGALCLLRKRRP